MLATVPRLGGPAARPAPRTQRSTRSTTRTACRATRSRAPLTGDSPSGRAILLAPPPSLFVADPSLALLACALLALATVLAVPLAFAGVLRGAAPWPERFQGLTILPVALSSLRATTLRSLALAATGAVALFGSVALGGAARDLLRGIERFAHSYSADAPIWVGTPGDNQATVEFRPGDVKRRIAAARRGRGACEPSRAGSSSSAAAACGSSRGRPAPRAEVLDSQLLEGNRAAAASEAGAKAAGSSSPSRSPKQHMRASGARSRCPPRAGPSA